MEEKHWKHEQGDKTTEPPVPKPRSQRTLNVQQEEEDEQSKSSTGPPLPPRLYRGTQPAEQDMVLASDEFNEDSYIDMSPNLALRRPSPVLCGTVQEGGTSKIPSRKSPPTPKSWKNQSDEQDFGVDDNVYDDTYSLPQGSQVSVMRYGPKTTTSPKPVESYNSSDKKYTDPTDSHVPSAKLESCGSTTTLIQPKILLPRRQNIKLPELPPQANRPVFLDVDTEQEVDDYDTVGKLDGEDRDTPTALAEDKILTSIVDEHAPITTNKKSIFYLVDKVSRFPGTSHWKNLAQALNKAKNPFLENNENNESLLTATARVGKLEVLKFLLQHGGDLNLHDKRMMYPIHTAALYGHNTLIEYMINNRVDINKSGNKGNTPLHYATLNSKIATINLLIQMDSNVNARNHSGKRPYELAKTSKSRQAQRLLEDATIDIAGRPFKKVREKAGRKPVFRAVSQVQDAIKNVKIDFQQEIEELKQENKKEIKMINEKADKQDQKIEAIETEYKDVYQKGQSQIMQQFQQMRVQQESMYETFYTQNLFVPPGRQVVKPELQKLRGMSHSHTCPVLTQQTSQPDAEDGYEMPGYPSLVSYGGPPNAEDEYETSGDPSSVIYDMPDNGKLSKDAKDKIQKNYVTITRNVKVKRIDAELLSAFVIDFETKSHWKTLSEKDAAEQFIHILIEGTVELISMAKNVLRGNNQDDIADLLP